MEADERFLQRSRIVLKPENFLEMHSADLISDDGSEKISDTSLSDIDDLDFAHLQSEIQDPPIGLNKENSPELEDDITLMDPVQLWSDAYANTKDPVHDIISSLQQNLRQHPIFRKLRIPISDCKIKDNRLYYRGRIIYSRLKKSSTLPHQPSSHFSFRRTWWQVLYF